MHSLYHTAHRPPLVLIVPHPTLPHNIGRVPRALLQPLVPQTLREDARAALPRAEPSERAPPRVREEALVDGAPRARAVYSAATPCVPAAGASASARQRWWRR